ncbi:glycosyl hydrolase family 71-domain-containing protein [Schizophyllum commune]
MGNNRPMLRKDISIRSAKPKSSSLSPQSMESVHPAFVNLENRYYRGDGWLLNKSWDQLMAMRSRMNFIEIQTWNDRGESHHLSANCTADQAAGMDWVNGCPHTAWMDMNLWYIQASRSGADPAVISDVLYFWARPHPAGATTSSDSLGTPTGYD